MNDSKNYLLPALIAVGGSFATADAQAIELGEINVQSKLGQPLRASIAYALAPTEQLADYCVSLSPALSNKGLPAITRAQVSVADGVISLTGRTVLREPLMSVRVDVACPYTPNLSREYMLFLDPAEPAAETLTRVQTTPQSEPVAVTAETAAPAARVQSNARNLTDTPRARISRPQPPAQRTPITNTTQQYRVQPGDSLSMIAQRIENRPVGLWDAVGQIFAANPDAFIDNDPNKLKAGSLLSIPDFGADARLVANEKTFEPAPDAAADLAPAEPVASDASGSETAKVRNWTFIDDAGVESSDAGIDEPAADTVVTIPDTEIEVPEPAASSPNVPTASVAEPVAEPGQPLADTATNWLLWFLGGGLTLIVGLLLFGRRNRGETGPGEADATMIYPMRRSTDAQSDSIEVEEITEPQLEAIEARYNIEDDSPTHENLALDADLEIGTGLSQRTDVHVAEDFGFAVNNELDLELPDESVDEDAADTDINAAIEEADTAVLENTGSDDDYDMSVIVDATKMPRPDEATEHDLKAVVVDEIEHTMVTDDYTLSRETDYQILEQDYEDELTATQALNMEIERAAAELAERIDDTADAEDKTAEMPLATVTELNADKNKDAGSAISDLDDTGANELVITEKIRSEEETLEMSAEDKTVEMTVESGKVDTKAG